MRRHIRVCAALTMIFAALLIGGRINSSEQQAGGYQITDVEGTVVTFAHKPQRILTVSAGTDELMLGLVEPERGEKLIGKMEDKLAEIRAKVAQVPEEKKHKSIALISIMVNYGGAGCTFDELCNYTDSINAKAAAGNRMGQEMTKEQLVAANPDYLFFPSYEDGATNEENYGRQYLEDPSLAQMTAVRERQIGHPWARYVYNLSQNIVYGIQETAWILYGDDFKQSHYEFLTAVE